MPRKIPCEVGLSDMLTGIGFKAIRRFDSLKEAKKFIRQQGIDGIPVYLRGKYQWTIKRFVKKMIDEDGNVYGDDV